MVLGSSYLKKEPIYFIISYTLKHLWMKYDVWDLLQKLPVEVGAVSVEQWLRYG